MHVFAGLEIEQAVCRFTQQLGNVAVEVAEKRVFVGLAGCAAIAHMPEHGAAVELPAGQPEVGLFLSDQAIAFCSVEQCRDDIAVGGILDFFVERITASPGAAFLELFAKS